MGPVMNGKGELAVAGAFPQEFALYFRGERLGAADHVAAMHRAQEFINAVGTPLHRALQRPGGPGHRGVLGVDAGLHAEAAADVADDHTHVLGLQPRQAMRQFVAHLHGLQTGLLPEPVDPILDL